MLTIRRIFQAKVGMADQVVQKVRELQSIGNGGSPKLRVFTDFFSGHTDRVVMEFDADNLSEIGGAERVATDDPAFPKWFEGLAQLIEGATVEIWKREEG